LKKGNNFADATIAVTTAVLSVRRSSFTLEEKPGRLDDFALAGAWRSSYELSADGRAATQCGEE